jgi:integrase
MKIPRFKPVFFERRTYAWGITIPPYLSPSGRVTRRFFLTLREAKEFGAHMRRRYDDHEHDSTYLSRDRLGEAAKAYDLIAGVSKDTGKTYTLAGIVEDWARRERQAARSVSLDTLFDEYIAARESSSTDIYRSRLRWCQQRLSPLGWRMVSQITSGDLDTALKRECASTRNNFLTYVRAMFNYGLKKGYLLRNPVDQIEFSVRKRREVEIYTPDEVQRLLDDALEQEPGLLPYRVLTLYCGIRPNGEATRVEWDDIKWEDRVVKLSAAITKKGRSRFPRLSDNAIAWLEEYRRRGGVTEGLIAPYTRNQLEVRHRANLERCGVKGIKNGARHSYCSYHLAQYNDINGLTLQSSHANTDMLWRHCYQAATKEDAARYWSIVPKAAVSNVVAMSA